MQIDLASLLQQYGYIALFIGAVLEGESVLVLAGFAAYRGELQWPLVLLAATLGGFLGDEIYFAIGRLCGQSLTIRYPKLKAKVEKANDLLFRYPSSAIIGVRFLYGLRIAGPAAIGMTSVSWMRFGVLNMVGAVLWALSIGGTGYVFGDVMQSMIGNLQVILMIVVVLFLVLAMQFLKKNRNRT